jgi:hypothetical protein
MRKVVLNCMIEIQVVMYGKVKKDRNQVEWYFEFNKKGNMPFVLFNGLVVAPFGHESLPLSPMSPIRRAIPFGSCRVTRLSPFFQWHSHMQLNAGTSQGPDPYLMHLTLLPPMKVEESSVLKIS